MSVIVYNLDKGQPNIQEAWIQSRYNNLKLNINNKALKNNIKEKRRKRIENFLNKANFILNDNSWENIQNKIFTKTDEGLGKKLESLANGASSLLPEGDLKVRQNFLQGLKELNNLYDQVVRNGGNIKIQEKELNKIYQACLKSENINEDLTEIGNLLGSIGAQAAEMQIAKTFEKIVQNLKNNNQVKIYDIGSQKKENYVGEKISLTTDTVLVIQDAYGNVVAKINFSDKFNTRFNLSQNSTVKPIKLVTRNIGNFISEVNAKNNSGDKYEEALFNYISYHATYRGGKNYNQFKRIDYTVDNKDSWKLLRQTIGLEMLDTYFNGLNGNYGSHKYEDDEIDIYVYGNKFFYGEDIINSAFNKKGDINRMAQVSLAKRKRWLVSDNIQSKPREWVLKGREEAIENNIRTMQITYSQVVKF